MIWLWIIAALVLSLIPLINKKIELPYYMWLLLPIDTYGISLAGAVIKPYMIFAILLPVFAYAKNKGRNFDLVANKNELFVGIVSFLILTVNIFNTDNFSSFKVSVMIMIVYLCAQCYVSCSDKVSSTQLSDIFIASSFGCAIVYIIAYMSTVAGLELPSVIAHNRTDPGLMLMLRNMVNGNYAEFLRLRGFASDPNAIFVQFIFGISACTSRLFKKFNLYHLFTFIISIICIVLSSSRMGLICCALCIIITSVICIKNFDSVKKKIQTLLAILAGATGFLIFFMSNIGQNLLQNLLLNYTNRSSLTDEYGRFSIWKECVSVYWKESPLFGVGLGNIQNFTAIERKTHNTWLQFICECGIIVGMIVVIFFVAIAIYGIVKIPAKIKNEPDDNGSFLSLVIGYIVTIISLVSVDNVTCSYLWFGALLILHLGPNIKRNSQTL